MGMEHVRTQEEALHICTIIDSCPLVIEVRMSRRNGIKIQPGISKNEVLDKLNEKNIPIAKENILDFPNIDQLGVWVMSCFLHKDIPIQKIKLWVVLGNEPVQQDASSKTFHCDMCGLTFSDSYRIAALTYSEYDDSEEFPLCPDCRCMGIFK